MSPRTILLLQTFLVFLQMANAAIEQLPQPYPILVAAFIGALQFYIQNLGNKADPVKAQSASPGKNAGILLVLFLLLLAGSTAQAQDSFIGPGVTLNANSAGNVQLSGVYERPAVKDLKLYTLTFADISGVEVKPFNTTNMQYAGSQALAFYIMEPTPWLRLGVLGEAGLAGTVDVAIGSKFGAGGVADLRFKNNFTLKIIPKFIKNTVTGQTFELRVYPGVKF